MFYGCMVLAVLGLQLHMCVSTFGSAMNAAHVAKVIASDCEGFDAIGAECRAWEQQSQ